MQYKDIEIFLELVSSRNITKASEHLFLAQSVISTRLKRLEEELGYSLFIRSKGMREIELTSQGREFITLAMRLQTLYEEAAELRDSSRQTLRIAAPESMYFGTLEPVLVSIMKKHPEIRISSQMADTSVVYELMESNMIDFGFASYESSHRNIIHRHAYDQHFSLVRAGDKKDIISPSELDPEKEIRLTGGNFSPVELWRDTFFPGHDSCRIEVSSPHMIVKFIKEFNGWALLPTEVAELMAKLYGVEISRLTDAPEPRKIYLLMHGGAAEKEGSAAKIFLEELNAHEGH